MSQNNSSVVDMTNDSLEKAISKCVNRLNELTDEQKLRKTKTISQAREEYEEAAKKFQRVATENGKTIEWKSFGETFNLWDQTGIWDTRKIFFK